MSKPDEHLNRYEIHLIGGEPQPYSSQMMLHTISLAAGLVVRQRDTRSLAVTTPSGLEFSFFKSRSGQIPRRSSALARNKVRTHRALGKRGIPVPEARTFPPDTARRRVMRGAKEIGYPLVVKPVKGRQGIGVQAGIQDDAQLKDAIRQAVTSPYGSSGILIEGHVPGDDLRILATRSRGLSAIKRVPASVTGTGKHSIHELIKRKNRSREANPYLAQKLIGLDERVGAILAGQGVVFDTILEAGRTVQLSTVANLSQGGESHEVTGSTHPSLLDLAAAAVSAVPGMPYAGVDIMVQDPAAPVEAQEAVVLEINGTPDILMHPFPAYGVPARVGHALVSSTASEVGLEIEEEGAELLELDDAFVEMAVAGDADIDELAAVVSTQAQRLDLECGMRPRSEAPVFQLAGSVHRIVSLVRRVLRSSSVGVSQVATRTADPPRARRGVLRPDR